ncbi:MAG TPA: winged helix DNA-binding domain-containing protein [Ktedonosporobacter sp.]|nr:winged helix DNA-binding domain-containing protein [Ktedonosporobacter sp.]
MKALKWHQVHAWRLAQHGLSPRFEKLDFARAVTLTGGIQAQVMSAAELALCTRVEGLCSEDVKSALWQDRTLVKTWAMRGTLHLLSASELPLYVAARGFNYEADNWTNYFAEYGISPAQQKAFIAAIPQVLGKEPMTRQQLASALVEYTGLPQLRTFILSTGWGTPLKPSAFRGELCFGPGQGQQVTFVNPRVWFGTWQEIEQQQALQHIARRYLQSYGPATPEDFAIWWGSGKVAARKLFQELSDELEEVDVEGWRALALRATLEPMQNLEPAETIHLLPLFDAYTIGMPRNLEPVLSQVHKNQVFRQQGWITAVILVNGSIQGVWHYTARRQQTVVKVHLFCPLTAVIQKGIEAEVERLRDFFESASSVRGQGERKGSRRTNVFLEYEHHSSPQSKLS